MHDRIRRVVAAKALRHPELAQPLTRSTLRRVAEREDVDLDASSVVARGVPGQLERGGLLRLRGLRDRRPKNQIDSRDAIDPRFSAMALGERRNPCARRESVSGENDDFFHNSGGFVATRLKAGDRCPTRDCNGTIERLKQRPHTQSLGSSYDGGTHSQRYQAWWCSNVHDVTERL